MGLRSREVWVESVLLLSLVGEWFCGDSSARRSSIRSNGEKKTFCQNALSVALPCLAQIVQCVIGWLASGRLMESNQCRSGRNLDCSQPHNTVGPDRNYGQSMKSLTFEFLTALMWSTSSLYSETLSQYKVPIFSASFPAFWDIQIMGSWYSLDVFCCQWKESIIADWTDRLLSKQQHRQAARQLIPCTVESDEY